MSLHGLFYKIYLITGLNIYNKIST
ncbi:hypothetical protein V391_02264, partial [Staphylococcus aureus T35615]